MKEINQMAEARISTYSIGWDVGGWNCDRNRRSRDAIVILNEQSRVVGKPWRGNLRETINRARNAQEWVSSLFQPCNAPQIHGVNVTLAIDAPLAFSTEFIRLAGSKKASGDIGLFGTNQYLYRKTERMLFEHGIARPLSAVNDMIGSQATKAMHVVAKFSKFTKSCGVWTDRRKLTVIEAYPACCKSSALVKKLRKQIPLNEKNDDIRDAVICAVTAQLFRSKRKEMWPPPHGISDIEGWIWLPKDIVSR